MHQVDAPPHPRPLAGEVHLVTQHLAHRRVRPQGVERGGDDGGVYFLVVEDAGGGGDEDGEEDGERGEPAAAVGDGGEGREGAVGVSEEGGRGVGGEGAGGGGGVDHGDGSGRGWAEDGEARGGRAGEEAAGEHVVVEGKCLLGFRMLDGYEGIYVSQFASGHCIL